MNANPAKIPPRRHSSPGCRITQKSVSMDDHHYFPSAPHIPRFGSEGGCRITEKNRWMGGYRFTYPVMGGEMNVTESEFHCRVTAKYRAMAGYKYVYPLPGKVEVDASQLTGFRDEKVFVPREVDKLVPGGVKEVLQDPVAQQIYIVGQRGDVLAADVRPIEQKKKKYRRSKTLPSHLEAPSPPLQPRSDAIDQIAEEKEKIDEEAEQEKAPPSSWLDKYKAEWKKFSVESKYASNCLLDFGEYRKYCEEEPGIDFSPWEIREEEEEKSGGRPEEISKVAEELTISSSLSGEKTETNGSLLASGGGGQSREKDEPNGIKWAVEETETNGEWTVNGGPADERERTEERKTAEKRIPPVVINDVDGSRSRIVDHQFSPSLPDGCPVTERLSSLDSSHGTVEKCQENRETEKTSREKIKLEDKMLTSSIPESYTSDKVDSPIQRWEAVVHRKISEPDPHPRVPTAEPIVQDQERTEERESTRPTNETIATNGRYPERPREAEEVEKLVEIKTTEEGRAHRQRLEANSGRENKPEISVGSGTDWTGGKLENSKKEEKDEDVVVNNRPYTRDIISDEETQIKNRKEQKDEDVVANNRPYTRDIISDEETQIKNRKEQKDEDVVANNRPYTRDIISDEETQIKNRKEQKDEDVVANNRPYTRDIISDEETQIKNRKEQKDEDVVANNRPYTRDIISDEETQIKNRKEQKDEDVVANNRPYTRDIISDEETQIKNRKEQKDEDVVANNRPYTRDIISDEETQIKNRKEQKDEDVVANNRPYTRDIISDEETQIKNRKEQKDEDVVANNRPYTRDIISDEETQIKNRNDYFNRMEERPVPLSGPPHLLPGEKPLVELPTDPPAHVFHREIPPEVKLVPAEENLNGAHILHPQELSSNGLWEQTPGAGTVQGETASYPSTGIQREDIGPTEEIGKEKENGRPTLSHQNQSVILPAAEERKERDDFRRKTSKEKDGPAKEILLSEDGAMDETSAPIRGTRETGPPPEVEMWKGGRSRSVAVAEEKEAENGRNEWSDRYFRQDPIRKETSADFNNGQEDEGKAERKSPERKEEKNRQPTPPNLPVHTRLDLRDPGPRDVQPAHGQNVAVTSEWKLDGSFGTFRARDVYVAVMDFTPLECDIGAIPMKSGQEVEIVDSSKPRKWLVRTRSLKGSESKEGWVPTCYLEKKTKSMTDITHQAESRTDPKEREAVSRREAIVKELVETEEDFARDMQYVVDNYYLEMDNTRMPKELRDQRESLFINFKPICEFHNNVLIKGVQYYAKEPALLGKTFLRLERDFDMHVNYCRDEAHAQQLLASGALKEYFNEHSRRIGDDKTLSEHLKLPIQRINDYQLLLRELIKYTARLKEDTTDLQKALDFMVCIPQRSADLKYLNAMQGYKGNIHKLGRLLKHGWLEVSEPTKSLMEKYVFLFKAHMFITDVKRVTSDHDTYIVKNIVKLQEVEIVEKVNGDDRAFRIQHKNRERTDYPLVFRAPNSEQKESWIKEFVTRSVVEDLGEDEPELAPEARLASEKEMENTESDVKSIEMEEECTDAKIPSLTSDIKIELPEEEGTANITESLRSESISSLEAAPARKRSNVIASSRVAAEIVLDHVVTNNGFSQQRLVITSNVNKARFCISRNPRFLPDIEANPGKGNPGKPEFLKPLKGITCLQGESATFECEVSSTPPATVKWLKNNKPIGKSQRIKIASQGNKYTLNIKEALPEDVGLYTVMANNVQGLVACSATLNIKQGLLGVPKEDSRPTTPGGTELPHAPVFKVKLKDTELLEGTSVRFELVVRGNPQPSITFYKNGKELKEDERVRISYETKEVFELILDHVTDADAGEYSCVAVNSEGKDTTTGAIKVTKHKILFRGLEEELERPPTPKPFKWFKDGKDFEASDRFQVSFSEEEDTLALVFQRVTPDDAGLYTCVASTSSGNKISCSAELTVQGAVHKLLRDPEAPKLKAGITDVEVSEGASAMLELKVSGYPKPTVTWFKDGKEIKASDRIRFLFEDEETFTLIIKNVKKDDAGKYDVTAKNDMGEVKESCKLTVTCPPSFRKKLKDMAVMTNEPVRFEVEVEGKPTPEVKWYKDGQQLSENDRIKMLKEKEEIFALLIDKVKPEDSGNYSCVLSNESGSQAGYSNLVVNAPPSFLKEMKNVECSEEETISFSLKVSGNPKPSLKWLKDGKELKIDGQHIKVTEEDNSYTLTINKVQKEDIGKYTCDITNAHGKASTSGNLATKGKPVFTKKLSDKEVKEGDVNVEFTVKVEGSPQPTIKWMKNGNAITEKENYKIISDQNKGEYTLKIQSVTAEESGKYTCEASNLHGSATTSGILSVFKPLSFTQTLKNTEVTKGEKVSLAVKFTGHPQPTIKWMKDGKELKMDGKHVQIKEDSESSTLILDEALKTDEGQYSCEISNKFGKENTKGSLSVKVKDDSVPPTFVKKLKDQLSVVGDAARFEVQVTGKPKPKVTWMKDGVEIKESPNAKIVSDGDDYSLTIYNLTLENGGKYSCQANNEKGKASDQAVLTVKEPTAPVVEGSGDVEIELGGVVKFAAKVTGFPIPDVKWYKNEKLVQESEQMIIISEKDNNNYSLTIKKVKQEDVGTYACVANNCAGTSRCEGKLSIKVIKPVESKPSFVKKLKPTDLIIGQPGRLEAKVTGEPKPKVTWLKNGEEVLPDEHITIKEEPDGTVALLIDIVSPDDVGTFSVMAANNSGDAMSTAQINAKSPPGKKPEFISGLKPTQLQENQPGRLQIKISGEPMPSIKWFKDGNEIYPSNHYTIMEEPDGTVNLLIDKVHPEDAGKYSVLISNEHGEVKSEAPVSTISPITGQKPELLLELKSINIMESQPLQLEAKISGEPSSVKWLKNGEEITPSEHVLFKTQPDGSYLLVINNTVPEDAGKYSIVATNALGKAHSSSLVEIKAIPKEKPEIIGNLEPLIIKKGETGKLMAKVVGQSPEIKWMKDDKEVIPSDRVKMKKEEDGTVSLVIDNMSSEDAGKYSLVAANKHGENRSSAPISITHPPCFIKTLKPLKVVEGYPAKLEIQVVGIPIPEVKWLKNNAEIKPDNERIIASTDKDGNATLLIKKAVPEDEGEYKCIASNSCGDSDCEGSVTVKGKSKGDEVESVPMIVSPLKDVTIKEGEPMLLEAQVSGFPIPDVIWYCNGEPLHPSETILPTFDGEKAVLEIKQSVAQHAGTFECKLSNPLGETSSKGNVNVLERKAPRFYQRFYDSQMSINEPISLTCKVRGDEPLEVRWYCNGELIEPGIKYNMLHDGEVCSLTFLNPNIQDGGIYECRVKNAAGEDINSAHVVFSEKMEKGEAPIFLKKIGDAEAMEGMTVKFTACIAGIPQPNVKWYKDGQVLESSPRCKIEQESSGILRLIVRDVESSDFGEYTVDISNIHGKESCSAKMRPDSLEKYTIKPIGDQFIDFDKFRKSGAPVPLPEKPYIVRMSGNYLTLGWKPSVPTSPRVPVTYQVEKALHPDGEWSTYKSGIKNCLCDVLDLESELDYKFRIRVENKHGVSDPSPYKTARRNKLLETKPVSRYEPMDFEIEHPELEKPAEAPRFLRKEEEVMYGIRGQPVTIEFWVYGHPEPEITWYYDGNLMEKDKYDFLRDRNGKVAVFLSKMTDAEVGTYVCHATNDLGDARQKISLQIAEAPSFIQRLDCISIMNRRSGRLHCRATGLPYPKIKWFKDWFPIYDSERYKILWEEPDKCTLFLNGVILKDAGLYSCTATNLAGTISCSAMVSVEESELEHVMATYSRPNIVKSRTKPFEDFYDIGDEVGRGTQAIIYHAVQRITGNSYAAKMMHGKGKVRELMNAEMDIMNQLCHPKLIRLLDSFESKSALTLITDLCGGGELLDGILKRGKLTERDVANYIKQILEGMEHMHEKNIGHFGLTIGDVLINHVNSNIIKVGDFGLAARLHSDKEYFLDYGHPEFVAPEIANKQAVSLAADMWSVGVITYLLLSGISPFLAENDMETLKKVQQGKINFFPDAFIGVSDDAKDFMSKLLVFDPNERMEVKTALQHRWLTGEGIANGDIYLNNIERLRDYHKKWKDWYSNASCKRFYRRRPLESCFTHPSKMIYPPGEEYTPPSSPEPELDRTHIKPAEFDDTYKQKINREAIDFRSETNYQNGPDTYLLQYRDTEFPLRIREYLRVGASLSPSLANSLGDTHWGDSRVTVRERRRFVDIMDEEITDERIGRGTRTIPMRLHHELGTTGYAREQMEMLKKEVWKDKGSREIEIGFAPYFREKIKDVIIEEDQEAVFSCYAIGDPLPDCAWFRNDGILIDSSRIQIKQTSDGKCELRLKPGKGYDVGVYKCVARNLHGESICRARLKLGSVPDRPDTPEIDQYSDNAVYITWRAPKYTGNTTILCYRVECHKAGEAEWTTVASNITHEFYVIHKLNPSTGYEFRVSARNKFGWSFPSIPSERVTTMAEGAPKIRITKARKYQQEKTEQSGEIEDEEIEETEIDYNIEKNPISIIEGNPTDLYNFVSEITRGKFSMIVKSWIKDLQSTLITKIIVDTEGNEKSGRKEYEIHRSLRHKNIVELVSASYKDNVTILVMEKLSGMDVLSYLSSHTEYNEETVAKIIIQVLNALEYLHFRGICYIELQPDNVVMIDEKYPKVKLIDFGSAQMVPKAGGKVDVKGRLEYLAPEVICQEDVYTTTDVWSIGVLTYILLSGCSPFQGKNEEDTTNNITFVRYCFDNLHKEVTAESTRFLIQTFKKCPLKRPTVSECLENKWLSPTEFMIRKRESAVFLSHRLHEFAEAFHTEKQSSTSQELEEKFGMAFSRTVSLEVDAYEEI